MGIYHFCGTPNYSGCDGKNIPPSVARLVLSKPWHQLKAHSFARHLRRKSWPRSSPSHADTSWSRGWVAWYIFPHSHGKRFSCTSSYLIQRFSRRQTDHICCWRNLSSCFGRAIKHPLADLPQGSQASNLPNSSKIFQPSSPKPHKAIFQTFFSKAWCNARTFGPTKISLITATEAALH